GCCSRFSSAEAGPLPLSCCWFCCTLFLGGNGGGTIGAGARVAELGAAAEAFPSLRFKGLCSSPSRFELRVYFSIILCS
ncbi:MAG: hypothetical protein J0M18_19360, partial [Ignavibacteria bacterium]|nr:hypothetical protein [Ignavibacteria bacterium]